MISRTRPDTPAERSLTFTKAVQVRAKRTCSQFAERSLTYTKVCQIVESTKTFIKNH